MEMAQHIRVFEFCDACMWGALSKVESIPEIAHPSKIATTTISASKRWHLLFSVALNTGDNARLHCVATM